MTAVNVIGNCEWLEVEIMQLVYKTTDYKLPEI